MKVIISLLLMFLSSIAFAQEGFDEESLFEEEGMFDDASESESIISDISQLEWHGFLEMERGARIGASEQHDETWMLSNIRFRLKTSMNNDHGGFDLKLDTIQDEITRETRVELREARIRYNPTDWLSLSIGQQISTWGVGDLIFINDLFPKNWVNMFLGRDIEMLKDSSNQVRATFYFGSWTWDVVWTPEFDPDTTPTGCRFSVFDPNTASLTSNPASCQNNQVSTEQDQTLESGEIATRLKTRIGSQEVSFYGYNGFWKFPWGLRVNESTGLLEPFYPRMGAYGVSSEGQWGPGIFFFEAGQYLSYEDQAGDDPFIPNSVTRSLVGYRYDLNATQVVSAQWFTEKMESYDRYEETAPSVQEPDQELENTLTFRFTQTAQQETLRASIFVYHRPEDRDGYLRYWVNKRINNDFDVTVGGNIFSGTRDYLNREFGMLRNDDNAYARVKYIF